MRILTLLWTACLALTSASCGGAKAGESCNTEGFLCQDAAVALECQVGKWIALPCRGAKGCSTTAGIVSCDMSANVEGDACAAQLAGTSKGLCAPDGKSILQCKADASAASAYVLVKTADCTSCTINGTSLQCVP